jgi:hypothetical protein
MKTWSAANIGLVAASLSLAVLGVPLLPAGPRSACAAVVKIGDVGVVGVRGGVVPTTMRITDSAAGLESADLTILYNTTLLDLSDADVAMSTYLTGQNWSFVGTVNDASGYAQFTMYTNGAPLTGGTPDLLTLTFHVPTLAPAGTSPLTIYTDYNLSRLNEGHLPLTPANGSVVIPFDWKGGSAPRPTDWGVSGNWYSAGVPDGTGVVVSFGKQILANSVVDLISRGRTVGNMVFAADASTTIQSTGGHALTLDNNGNAAVVNVAGNHTISTAVVLNSDVLIGGTGTLSLSGGLSGPHTMSLLAGSSVTARSIQVDTLSIGPGASVVVAETSSASLQGGLAGSSDAYAATPEPGAWALLATGAACLLALASRANCRRRPRAATPR